MAGILQRPKKKGSPPAIPSQPKAKPNFPFSDDSDEEDIDEETKEQDEESSVEAIKAAPFKQNQDEKKRKALRSGSMAMTRLPSLPSCGGPDFAGSAECDPLQKGLVTIECHCGSEIFDNFLVLGIVLKYVRKHAELSSCWGRGSLGKTATLNNIVQNALNEFRSLGYKGTCYYYVELLVSSAR